MIRMPIKIRNTEALFRRLKTVLYLAVEESKSRANKFDKT